jgi:hypothetical protein
MLSYLISILQNIVSFRAQPYSVSHLPLIFFYERYKGNSGLTDVHISKTVSFTRRLNSSFLFLSLDDFDVVCCKNIKTHKLDETALELSVFNAPGNNPTWPCWSLPCHQSSDAASISVILSPSANDSSLSSPAS